MNKDNYKVEVTLKGATLDETEELIDIVTQDIDLDVEEFTVKLFKQNPDESWEPIGTPDNPEA
jgi:hypothetical protein